MKKLLEQQLWHIANKLCGKMDADAYLDAIKEESLLKLGYFLRSNK
ncbi:hypothetical protein [Winogradskyella sp.]|nr:hypothetical protein [Winogradskyella sp.]